MSNVKETKEIVVGVMTLGKEIALAAKGKTAAEAFLAVINKYQTDTVFKGVIDAAIADSQMAGNEIKSLDFAGSVELISAVVAEVPALVGALK